MKHKRGGFKVKSTKKAEHEFGHKKGRKRSRIGLLWGNVSHDNEQYAQLATYMRLKNIVPPSASEK